MNQPLFREQAFEHQRARLWGDVILTQPVSLPLVTIAIAVALAAIIAYLALGTYTRKHTVQGYLAPKAGLVEVLPVQTGTVSRVHIKSGEFVDKGDLLAEIKTDRSLDNGHTVNTMLLKLIQQQKDILQQRINRRRSRLKRRDVHLKSQIANTHSQINQLEKQLRLQEERLDLARQRYHSLKSLNEQDLISESDYQKHYQSLLDERQKLQRLQNALLTERSRLQEAEFELNSNGPDTEEEIDRLKSEIARLEQRSIQSRGEVGHSIKAPISGRVTSLQIARGQSIDPRQPALAILPRQSALQAKLLIPTRAIGFLQTGLEIEMKYSAFPYERFGIYKGHIQQIARTVLSPGEVSAPLRVKEPVYRATADLNHQKIAAYGRDFPLQSGMTFEADILLDERPLYQWILKPLYSLEGTL